MTAGNDQLTRMDILLMLLLAEGLTGEENEPISGKTRLQKELFLSQKALKDFKISGAYSFRPYHYGPYCKDIYNDIEWLKSKSIVEEDCQENVFAGIIRNFKLSAEGVSKARERIEKSGLEKQFRLIKEIKRKFNQMDVVTLVEFTHAKYPEYVGS